MKRRIWPDIVIVIAVLGIGFGGVWALWGDQWWKATSGKREVPETSAGTPMT